MINILLALFCALMFVWNFYLHISLENLKGDFYCLLGILEGE